MLFIGVPDVKFSRAHGGLALPDAQALPGGRVGVLCRTHAAKHPQLRAGP